MSNSDDWLDEMEMRADRAFARREIRDSLGPLGKTGNGDPRLDHIDRVINDAYEEAIRWHNARIAEGTDPRTGLRHQPYIPWDERIDGAAASMTAYAPGSYERNGGVYRNPGDPLTQTSSSSGGGCVILLLVAAALMACMAVAMLTGGW
jgi:hypothetical protein